MADVARAKIAIDGPQPLHVRVERRQLVPQESEQLVEGCAMVNRDVIDLIDRSGIVARWPREGWLERRSQRNKNRGWFRRRH